MKDKLTIIIFSTLLVFLISCTQDTSKNTAQDTPLVVTEISSVSDEQYKVIEIAASSFVPNTLTINAGETVKFINKDSNKHWPASGKHPIHEAYPEPGGCIASKFDACTGLNQGEMFSFRFDKKGTWKYHDHLDPSLTGTIIVE